MRSRETFPPDRASLLVVVTPRSRCRSHPSSISLPAITPARCFPLQPVYDTPPVAVPLEAQRRKSNAYPNSTITTRPWLQARRLVLLLLAPTSLSTIILLIPSPPHSPPQPDYDTPPVAAPLVSSVVEVRLARVTPTPPALGYRPGERPRCYPLLHHTFSLDQVRSWPLTRSP